MRLRGRLSGIILLLALLLAACGGQAPATQPEAASQADPTTAPAAAESSTTEGEATEGEATEGEATEQDTRGTLRLAHPLWFGGIESMDPAEYTCFWEAMPLVYDTLARPDENWHPVPELATAWEPNEDATIWTFTLRDDVTFHDGKPFTSADVAYTFAHIMDPEIDGLAKSVLQIIEQVETPDEQTAVFHLAQPHAEFPVLLMGFETSIIPVDSGDTIGETGIGTGPFKLETLDPAGTTRLVANDDYWQGKPGVAAVEFISMPESSARLQALQAGQIDLVSEITPQQAEQLATNTDIIVDQFPGGTWYAFVMRTDTPPFDDVRVRKAMRLVVDRQQMLDLTYGGQGIVSCDTTVAPQDSYYRNGECPQDIEQAKALLTEAGYADGLDVTLFTSDVLAPFIPMAEVYQQQAAAAGINVTIEQVPADVFYAEIYDIEAFVSANEMQYPADMTLHIIYGADSPLNTMRMNEPEFNQLLQQARAEMDPEKRTQRYLEAQEWLFAESGLLVAYHIDYIQAYTSSVAGVPSMNRYYAPWHEITKTEE
jgi:peptide/nickel transport system substrate-binding protein